MGYGCTTCIGNSGPLPARGREGAITDGQLVASAVLSGNRNFEGRVSPHVKANYLASPPLVVAYALAGTTDIDLTTEPLGHRQDGNPGDARRRLALQRGDRRPRGRDRGGDVRLELRERLRRQPDLERDPRGRGRPLRVQGGVDLHPGAAFLPGPDPRAARDPDIQGARVLAVLGDSVTTDHISPAGDIPLDSPAGRYLVSKGLEKKDFNSYGSRRGNDRVMVRGTFANIRLKNQMVPGVEGGVTVHVPSGERMAIFDAAERYRAEGTPLVVVAGQGVRHRVVP